MTKSCTLRSRLLAFAVYSAGFLAAKSSLQASDASGRFVHVMVHPPPDQTSCFGHIHLVTEAVEQGSSFGPNSDQPGRQLSWCIGCNMCRRQTIYSSAFLTVNSCFPAWFTPSSVLLLSYTAGPQIDPVDASARQRHVAVDLAWHPRRRMLV